MITLGFLLFGLCVGSYLNVLIYRLPRNIDTVAKGSHCTKCQESIPWYTNIPLLGFLFLRGKCLKCKERISFRYPVIELLTGVLSVLLMPHQLNTESLYFYFFYFSTGCVFICHTLIDLEFKLLPDKLNIYLGLLFLTNSLMYRSVEYWLLGFAVGFGFPYLVTWVFYKIKGQIGLGGGDIKLFGVLGLLLGAQGVIHTIFLSCFLGALISLALIGLRVMKRDQAMPFGPFILLTASLQIYFPKQMTNVLKSIGFVLN